MTDSRVSESSRPRERMGRLFRLDAAVLTTRVCVAFFGLLASVTLSFAQSGSAITGVVRDSSGAFLAGASVEVGSPALIEGKRTTTTDGNGQYKVVDLRPGEYSVTFTLQGFQTLKREAVALPASFTATM